MRTSSGVLWGFLRQGVCRKAFEEDKGLKMGSGVAESDEEEQDEDQVGEQNEIPRQRMRWFLRQGVGLKIHK